MGEIVIEEANYKAFVMALASLFMLIASITIVLYGLGEHRPSYWIPSILAAGIFFVGFVKYVAKTIKEKPLLTITMDGIIDQSSKGGVGFIAFDDIKEFVIVTISNKEAIAVIPKNVDGFLSKYAPIKRRVVKKNMNSNLPPVTIYVDMAKDMEPEDILSLLKKRLSDYSSLYE